MRCYREGILLDQEIHISIHDVYVDLGYSEC